MDKVVVGEKIPDFSLLDQNEQTITTADLVKHEWSVLFFYPKDNTPG